MNKRPSFFILIVLIVLTLVLPFLFQPKYAYAQYEDEQLKLKQVLHDFFIDVGYSEEGITNFYEGNNYWNFWEKIKQAEVDRSMEAKSLVLVNKHSSSGVNTSGTPSVVIYILDMEVSSDDFYAKRYSTKWNPSTKHDTFSYFSNMKSSGVVYGYNLFFDETDTKGHVLASLNEWPNYRLFENTWGATLQDTKRHNVKVINISDILEYGVPSDSVEFSGIEEGQVIQTGNALEVAVKLNGFENKTLTWKYNGITFDGSFFNLGTVFEDKTFNIDLDWSNTLIGTNTLQIVDCETGSSYGQLTFQVEEKEFSFWDIFGLLKYINPFHESFFLRVALLPSDTYFLNKGNELNDLLNDKLPVFNDIVDALDAITEHNFQDAEWEGVKVEYPVGSGNEILIIDPYYANEVAPTVKDILAGVFYTFTAIGTIVKISRMLDR